MIKTFLKLTITGIMAVVCLPALGQENKKAANARKNVAESKEDLREAKKDSAADFQKFKQEAERKIKENERKIEELKRKKNPNESQEIRDKYDRKVSVLAQNNNKLKKKIEGCNHTKTSTWTSFKTEFNHDMTELGHAIKDIGVDNKK